MNQQDELLLNPNSPEMAVIDKLSTRLEEAQQLIKGISSALNALPNKKIPANDAGYKDTYAICSAIDKYKRKYNVNKS